MNWFTMNVAVPILIGASIPVPMILCWAIPQWTRDLKAIRSAYEASIRWEERQ